MNICSDAAICYTLAMSELKLIHGRQSVKYNHFREYDPVTCRAVASRLMGVTALRVTWRSRSDRRAVLYQVMHLDYSEYGVDEYQEFDCLPETEDFSAKKKEMNELWEHFTGVMGSEVISIDMPCLLRLVETALPLASEDMERQYDDDENREFREYARLRLGYMTDALNERGITSADCSTRDAIETLSPLKLSSYETINYFIMRMIDRDFDAAACLSTIDIDELRENMLAEPGIQTLMRCDIERSKIKTDPPADGKSYPFRCRITTLAKDAYYHYTFVIWLNGNYRSKNPLVTEIQIGSVLKLSEYEAAMQISRPEYLTVFACKDDMLRGFDAKYIGPFSRSTQTAVPNGWLYTAFKGNNSHVDSPHYRLDDDVYGYALLSIGGELILMSHDLRSISMLDDATIFSLYAPFIDTKGRYRLDASVFQTLCQNPGVLFDDLVEPGE